MKNKVYFGENQEHVKLYKKGKVWVASLVTLFSMGLGVGLSNANAHAATTTNSSSATKVSNQVLASGTSTSSSSTTTSTSSSSTATTPAGSSSNSSSSSSSSTNSSSSSSSNTAQPINESGTFSKTSAYNSMSGDDCNSYNGVSANVSNSKHNGGSYQVSLTPVTGSTAASITVNISDWDADAGNIITGVDGSATGNSNGSMIYQDAISFTINDGQIAYDSDAADGQQLMQEVITDIQNNWALGYKPLFTFSKNPSFNLAQFKGYTGTINITLNYTHGAVQQHNTITAKRPISAVFSNGQPAKVFNGKSNVTQTITFNSTEILDVTNSQPANVVTTPATQTMPSYPVPQIPGFTTTIVYAGEGSEISGGGNVSIVRAANDDSNTVVKEVDNVKPNQALPPVKVIYAAQNSQGTFSKGSNPNASVSGDNVNNGGSWTFSPLIPADASKDTITINFVDPNANRVIADDNGTISTTQSANGKTNIWSQTFDGNQLDPQQVANIIQTELQELWNQGYKPLFTVGQSVTDFNNALSKVNGNLVLNLNFTHRVEPKVIGSKTVTKTIHYVYSGTNQQAAPAVTQTVTFNETQPEDMVNGTVIANSPVTVTPTNGEFPSVASPNIPGYRASQAQSTATQVTSADANDPAGQFDETITYTKDPNAPVNNNNNNNVPTNNAPQTATSGSSVTANGVNGRYQGAVNTGRTYNRVNRYAIKKANKNVNGFIGLPKTGEQKSTFMSIIGLMISGILGMFGLADRRKDLNK